MYEVGVVRLIIEILKMEPVENWTKTDLLFACKKNKVKGYTRMKKPQLIEEVKKIMTGMKGVKL